MGHVCVCVCSSREMLTGQRLCQSKSHQDSVLSALNQQRKDGLLCDVTLVAGEQKFHAHKAVLAACSDYFRVSHPPFDPPATPPPPQHRPHFDVSQLSTERRGDLITCIPHVAWFD